VLLSAAAPLIHFLMSGPYFPELFGIFLLKRPIYSSSILTMVKVGNSTLLPRTNSPFSTRCFFNHAKRFFFSVHAFGWSHPEQTTPSAGAASLISSGPERKERREIPLYGLNRRCMQRCPTKRLRLILPFLFLTT